LGVPGEVVGERLGGAEHAEQPVAQRLRRDERVEQLAPRRLVLLRLDQPDEAEERQVRVGGAAERVQEQRVGAHGRQGGGVEQPFGGGRIGEAESQQPGEGAASAAARPPSPFVRHRRHCPASCSINGGLEPTALRAAPMSCAAATGLLSVYEWPRTRRGPPTMPYDAHTGTPHTSIDPRYSSPGAEPTSWAAAERLLTGAELFWISTVRPGGRPHVTPL